MKKILEVLQYGDTDIRFNTDIDPTKDHEAILDVIARVSFAMATKLWGGNEQAVLAMIRALAIADLSMSVNRSQMIKHLEASANAIAKSMHEARREFERNGGKVMTFAPGIMPNGSKS